MCNESLRQQTVLKCWSTSQSMLGRSKLWISLEWKCLPTLICPFYSLNSIRMFYKCFINGGQTVAICLYYDLFIQESANVSETVQKCWPTSLFRNMVIKQGMVIKACTNMVVKACTNLTYLGYILDHDVVSCCNLSPVSVVFGLDDVCYSILLAVLLFQF